jgi:outer membrane protein OmpA-like peptidoglycan-associated protein
MTGNAAARADLLTRLNSALPTRETDRGLVSAIGGVQFATGTADLSAAARESLARFSGIVASYPDLKFTIEGHTDNTGSLVANNELSLRRAIVVRDYLIAQMIPASSIDAQGLGPSRPVASNETADGRSQNRRVVIVISGGMFTAN